jgi:hypothetical protein
VKPTQLPSVLIAILSLGSGVADSTERSRTFNFDQDKPNRAPRGFSFTTAGGPEGRWVVRAEKDAPSGPNVLAQADASDVDSRYPVALADEPQLRDFRASVRCKMITGKIDQTCGLVFRYQDASNYLVVRGTALDGNIRLYIVQEGRRRAVESFIGAVTGGVWHELSIEAKGEMIEASWDGMRVIKGRVKEHLDAGKIGVATKADAVTYFDDLSVAPL